MDLGGQDFTSFIKLLLNQPGMLTVDSAGGFGVSDESPLRAIPILKYITCARSSDLYILPGGTKQTEHSNTLDTASGGDISSAPRTSLY